MATEDGNANDANDEKPGFGERRRQKREAAAQERAMRKAEHQRERAARQSERERRRAEKKAAREQRKAEKRRAREERRLAIEEQRSARKRPEQRDQAEKDHEAEAPPATAGVSPPSPAEPAATPDSEERIESLAADRVAQARARAEQALQPASGEATARIGGVRQASGRQLSGAAAELVQRLAAAEEKLRAHDEQDREIARQLAEAEERLKAEAEATEQALEQAGERLRQIEARAEAAEERARRAEQVAQARAQGSDREERLRELVDQITAAEERARLAEERAKQAVQSVAGQAPAAGEQAQGEQVPPPAEAPSVSPIRVVPEPGREPADESRISSADVTAAVQALQEQEPEGESSSEPDSGRGPQQEPPPRAQEEDPPQAEAAPVRDEVNINTAVFEELRAAGLSVSQTARLLAERERLGGFSSLDQLDRVAGFPKAFLNDLKARLTVG